MGIVTPAVNAPEPHTGQGLAHYAFARSGVAAYFARPAQRTSNGAAHDGVSGPGS